MPDHYDLIVIGSGPAGEKGAVQVAYFGKRIALVEKEPVLGGAAANTGTLPSKTLRETALFLSGFRNRNLGGGLNVNFKKRPSVGDFLMREREVKESERSRIHANLKRHRVALYIGTASFVDASTVSVKPENCPELRLTADKFLVASGTYPFRPPFIPYYDPRIYDSDTILTLREIPETMVVVGGGVIGCEYACMFAALGVSVTVIERSERLVGFMDDEICAVLQSRMEAMGVTVHVRDSVAGVDATGEELVVQLQSGREVGGGVVLVSSGRCGNGERLNLPAAGVAVGDRGKVKVNEFYQANVPNVYAAGDVVGSPALASVSMEQARTAMCHAFDLTCREAGVSPVLPYG